MQKNPKPHVLQLAKFWTVFSKKEKKVFLALLAIAIVSGWIFTTRFFHTHISSVPTLGGSYTEGVLEEPRFINPILATNDTEQALVDLVFQTLFRYNAKGQLEPELAESLQASADGKSYTIVLKKNLQWHDKQPVTADDVLFTISMIQNPDYKSPLRPNWQGVTAEKTDDQTVILHLHQSYAAFTQNLTFGILPKHLWSSIRPENSFQAELNVKPIGSGPYQFKKLTRSTDGSILSYTVERVSAPRNNPPHLQTITFQVFRSEEVMLANYQRGKIDGMSTVSAENASKISRTTNVVYSVPLPQVFGLFLNQSENPLLADKKIRQALDLAIDKQGLIDMVLFGAGVIAASPLPEGALGFDNSIQPVPFDKDQAIKILNDAGWTIDPATHFREKTGAKTKAHPDGIQPLRITITTSDWPDLVEVAQYIKKSWQDIGVDAVVQTAPITELEHDSIRTRKYEVLLFGESFGRDFDPFAFWDSSQIKNPGLNIALYSNKQADTLLESARRTDNTNDIIKKYKDFQKLVVADHLAIFLYTPYYFFVMNHDMHGVQANGITRPSERFYNEDAWFMNTSWKLK